jgi:hypothetical protein
VWRQAEVPCGVAEGSEDPPTKNRACRPFANVRTHRRRGILVAEHLVLKDFSFDRASRRIECEVD